MKYDLKEYFKTWYAIIVRPIWFYTKIKDLKWDEAPMTFAIMTSWIIAIITSVVIFITQYYPIGKTLVEGITGFKFIIISPVLLVLASIFLFMTAAIVGGFLTLLILFAFYVLGVVLHFTLIFLKGKGKMLDMIGATYYSSAALLFMGLIILIIPLAKKGIMNFSTFQAGFNMLYFLVCLYLYGLWSIAGRKLYGVEKGKAFIAAAIPVILLIVFIIVFNKIGMEKLQPWIT